MCGLVGIAGDTNYKFKDVFEDLLMADAVRGMHSTGAGFVIEEKGKHVTKVVKRPGPSQLLLSTDEFNETIRTTGVKVIIGHNRHATVGDHTAENAHPFDFKGLMGAHNGTIDKYAISKLHEAEKYGTDSEALYATIDKFGVQDAIDKATGAWALTWYDKKKHTINFLTNGKRPLFYTYSKDRCTLLWASEAKLLDWVMSRHGVDRFEEGWYSTTENQHLSWVVPANNSIKFKKPEATEVKHNTPVFVANPNVKYNREFEGKYGWQALGDSGRPFPRTPVHQTGTVVPIRPGLVSTVDTKTPGTQSTIILPWRASFDKVLDTRKFRPPYKDAFGKIQNKIWFEQLMSKGCTFCEKKDTKWGKFIQALPGDLNGDPGFLCETCYLDTDVRDLVKNVI